MANNQGHNANKNGASYEKLVNGIMFHKFGKNYEIKNRCFAKSGKVVYCELFKDGHLLCKYSSQEGFTNIFLKRCEISVNMKKEPDGAFYFPDENRIIILEIKKQASSGSVNEKLGLGAFLRDYPYKRILKKLDCKRDIVYILDEFFESDDNQDYFDYMNDNNILYHFGDTFPLEMVGLEEVIKSTPDELEKVREYVNGCYDNPIYDLF